LEGYLGGEAFVVAVAVAVERSKGGVRIETDRNPSAAQAHAAQGQSPKSRV
jgi:hypothetical protein